MPRLSLREKICIRSYSGPHFLAFGLNMERYVVSLSIQSECRKIRTGITPNMDNFSAVSSRYYIVDIISRLIYKGGIAGNEEGQRLCKLNVMECFFCFSTF